MQTMVAAGADKIWVWPDLAGAFRAIRYDVRGFGRSPAATEEYTLLGDLHTVLEHFGVGSAHVAGCSMGGICALEFALAEPGRVKSLVLLCPGIGGYPYPDEPELDLEFAELIGAGDEDGLVSAYVRLWGAAGPTPFVTDLARSAVRAGANEELFQRPGPPSFDRLGEISTPTVIMAGDRPVIAHRQQRGGRRTNPRLRPDPDARCRSLSDSTRAGTGARNDPEALRPLNPRFDDIGMSPRSTMGRSAFVGSG